VYIQWELRGYKRKLGQPRNNWTLSDEIWRIWTLAGMKPKNWQQTEQNGVNVKWCRVKWTALPTAVTVAHVCFRLCKYFRRRHTLICPGTECKRDLYDSQFSQHTSQETAKLTDWSFISAKIRSRYCDVAMTCSMFKYWHRNDSAQNHNRQMLAFLAFGNATWQPPHRSTQ